MSELLKNINYIRYNNNFDYSKIPIINNEIGKISLDIELNPNNWIDELRVANFVKNPPRPKIIPTIDIVELERQQKYGMRVDIQPETLYERFKQMVVKVPSRRENGTIIYDPPLPPDQQSRILIRGRNPVMRNMTFTEMLSDPASLFFRVNQLIDNANRMPEEFARRNRAFMDQQAMQNISVTDFQDMILDELELIKNHLLDDATKFRSTFEHDPMFEYKEQSLRKILSELDDAVLSRMRARIYANLPVLITPEEIIGGTVKRTENTFPVYSYISGQYPNQALQYVLPAYIRFVSETYSDELQFNLVESMASFARTGGPRHWLSLALTGPMPLSLEMGTRPTPFQPLAPTEDIPSTGIVEEDPEIKEGANISLLFEDENITIPEIGGVLDANWYNTEIQVLRNAPTDPNYGNRGNLLGFISTMSDPDVNLGSESFANKGSSSTIITNMVLGRIRIRIVANDNYVYEETGQ